MGISARQFEQMKQRLDNRDKTPQPVNSAADQPIVRRHQVILGLDPSLRGTGWGVIRLVRRRPLWLAHDTIRCPAQWQRSRCLVHIAEQLRIAIRRHQPTVCVVEGLFYAQNLKTALIMGEARGAGLVAAAEAGLEVYEIAPRKVKQAIVGYGGAQKQAVARMVQRMLNLDGPPPPDAADALALALAFAQEHGGYALTPPKKV